MKVTLVSYGTIGDCIPLVALGARLQAAGHHAVMVAEGHGRDLAERYGLEFHALAGDITDLMRPGAAMTLTLEAGRFTRESLRADWRDDRAWLETIMAAASGSDMLVGMPMASYHALSVAGEVGAVPVVAELQPLAPTKAFPPLGIGEVRAPAWTNKPLGRVVDAAGWALVARPVNRARRTLGLPQVGNPTRGVRRLGAWSPTFVPRPADWPPRISVTGVWRLPPQEWRPDADLQDFLDAGDPPVYVGFGSIPAYSGTQPLLDALSQGLAGRRVILSGGAARAWPGLESPDVFLAGAVPHEWLFPRCAAVVHHCGAGTSHAALLAGTPVLPVPLMLDQPFWAERLWTLGVASRPLDRHSPNPNAVRAALQAAETPGVRARAREVAETVSAEDGTGAAVAALEQLVAPPGRA
jgi:UDP:flavonoid glycosyltransferase YjiC (YdhE family)